MKITLMVLLCLLVGCKELGLTQESPPPPIECPLMATLPIHNIYLRHLPKSFHYEVLINNQLLWNSCSQESHLSIISATTSYEKEDFSAHLQIYENIFQENTLADVKIYKTDAACVADTTSEVQKAVMPEFTTRWHDLPPGCGGPYGTTSTSLSVQYGDSPQ